MVKPMQNDLIKIKIRKRFNKYVGQDGFYEDSYSVAYIHASDILDIADDYITIEHNKSIIRYIVTEPVEDVVNRINEKLNTKK